MHTLCKQAFFVLAIAGFGGSMTTTSAFAQARAPQPSSKDLPITVRCQAQFLISGEKGEALCSIPPWNVKKIWDKKPKQSCQADGPKPRQPNDRPLPRGKCKNWKGQIFDCPKPKARTTTQMGKAKGKKPSGAPKVNRVFPAIP
jgi:hypothetical protein